MNHQLTKQLVKAVLKSPYALKWSAQGLGMLRTYLSEEVRLHIWDKSLQIENVSPLHDHPWHFDSHVVVGEIRQHRFTLHTKIDKPDKSEWNLSLIKCGAGACTLSDPVPVILRELPLEVFREGDDYRQHRNEIHQSTPVDGTVTLITRRFAVNRDAARVFWKGKGGFVSAEPRPASFEEVKRVTEKALDLWF